MLELRSVRAGARDPTHGRAALRVLQARRRLFSDFEVYRRDRLEAAAVTYHRWYVIRFHYPLSVFRFPVFR